VIAAFIGRAPAAAVHGAGDRRRYGGRDHLGRERGAGGTLIRHAGGQELEASAVGALVIAVVQPSQLTGLVAGAGGPQRPPARFPAALQAAVDLAAIATPAQVEQLPAAPTPVLSKALDHRTRVSANAGR
jgi:hypothetical protein